MKLISPQFSTMLLVNFKPLGGWYIHDNGKMYMNVAYKNDDTAPKAITYSSWVDESQIVEVYGD